MSDVDRMIENAAMALMGSGEKRGQTWSDAKAISEDALKSLGLPLETLAALKAGAWKAVPVEPTIGMLDRIISLSECETDDDLYDIWAAMLAAAPAKPEERGDK